MEIVKTNQAEDLVKAPGKALRAELLQRDAVSKAADRLMEGLDATTPQGWPDHRNRMDAADRIMNRVDGKVIERRHEVHETVTTAPSMDEILASPAARENLVRDLLKSEVGREEVRAQLAVVDV